MLITEKNFDLLSLACSHIIITSNFDHFVAGFLSIPSELNTKDKMWLLSE